MKVGPLSRVLGVVSLCLMLTCCDRFIDTGPGTRPPADDTWAVFRREGGTSGNHSCRVAPATASFPGLRIYSRHPTEEAAREAMNRYRNTPDPDYPENPSFHICMD
jgi:hypothetical protein